MKGRILIAIISCLTVSCISPQEKKQPKTFYNTIAGWDIDFIPIIEPYLATSLDKGVSWHINRPEGSFDVSAFGVSQNFIFGKSQNNWFLFDTKSRLYAEYKTLEELTSSVHSFNVPVNTIATCKSYFDSLTQAKKLYWFPKNNEPYPNYPEITPDAVTTIEIKEDTLQPPHFSFEENLSLKTNGVYFFKVNYNKMSNDLYHLSFNNSPPILVKDSLLIPVFSDNSLLEITLYIPYPVAQTKGISEEKRFIKTKTAYIR